jgi:hypothetical protein
MPIPASERADAAVEQRRSMPRGAILCCAVFIGIVVAGSLLVPWLSPYAASGFEEKSLLEPPSRSHWMGTDALGRDVLTRLLYGARVSLAVGVGTALIALVIGTAYGMISGFAGSGSRRDHLMMRLVDIFYGVPDMLMFILLSLVVGRNIAGLLIALGLVSWVRFARLARGQVLQAREFLFVEGARAHSAQHSRADPGDAHVQHSGRDPRRIDAELHRTGDQRSLQRLGHELGNAGPGRLAGDAELSPFDLFSGLRDFPDDIGVQYTGQCPPGKVGSQGTVDDESRVSYLPLNAIRE